MPLEEIQMDKSASMKKRAARFHSRSGSSHEHIQDLKNLVDTKASAQYPRLLQNMLRWRLEMWFRR
jgi:hypothetical protein